MHSETHPWIGWDECHYCRTDTWQGHAEDCPVRALPEIISILKEADTR